MPNSLPYPFAPGTTNPYLATPAGNVPTQPFVSYAHDEDLLIYAAGDFAELCPEWQVIAQGNDGKFASDAPWVLTSASIDFGSQGVAANQVVQLTAPRTAFPGSTGHFLAIDSVSGNSVTLRRPYKDLNVGQPPAPAAGLGGVEFAIRTLDPQLAEASYDLNQRFDISTRAPEIMRSPTWIYDLQVLRVATVYSVLAERYLQENRTDRGDFKQKAAMFAAKRNEAIARIEVRWSPSGGNDQPPTTVFNTRLRRG